MQLDKIVAFHKAMGDPTRIRIVALLQCGIIHRIFGVHVQLSLIKENDRVY